MTERRLRWVAVVAAGAWAGSWVLVWREIFHWRHMTKTLRFRAPDPPPGSTVVPRPGLPVRALRAVAVTAPVVAVLAWRSTGCRNWREPEDSGRGG